MKIKCLIIDDEPLAVDLLRQYIEQVPYLEVTGSCYSGLEALEWLRTGSADLVFLDINMPRLSGMELASMLHQKLIFTTAYSEYAAESYEKEAVDYLVKPITFDRFVRAVHKAIDHFRISEEQQSVVMAPKQDAYFFVKSGKAIVQLFFDSIQYIEGLKDYVKFVTTEQQHVVHKRMKELEQMLPQQFIRVHHSYIINEQYIRKIEDHHILIGSASIPVSEKYREAFYQRVQKKII